MPLVLVHGANRTPLVRDLSVGAGKSCELFLAGARDHHATVVTRGDKVVIRPADGAEVYVAGVAVEPGAERWLHVGDVVEVGGEELTVDLDETDAPLRTAELALAIVRRLNGRRAPIVHVVEGPDLGQELVLEEESRAHRIGRAPTCALVLEDPTVSREHVRITHKAGSVFAADMEAPRGTFLGRDRLVPGADAVWNPQRALRIGKTVLRVHLPDAPEKVDEVARALVPAEPAPPPAPAVAVVSPEVVASEAFDAPRSLPEPVVAAAPIVEGPPITPVAPAQRTSKPTPVWVFRVGMALVVVVAVALLYWIMR